MNNKMSHLRNHLFTTIEWLLDENNPMDIERAKTVAATVQVAINAAKAEVDLINAVGPSVLSDFFDGSTNRQIKDMGALPDGGAQLAQLRLAK